MVGLLSRTRKQASGGFARRCHRNAVARLSRFRDDEAGSMLVFGMYMFFLMWAFAGIAVDVMRHETLRTNLQNTVDRASLAAASLRQTLDPETVVLDYFAKAGLSEYVESVDPDSGLNSSPCRSRPRRTCRRSS
ncbi:MAG: pilus assembly protein TadG-related protein [Paracoccaceae bacterium]